MILYINKPTHAVVLQAAFLLSGVIRLSESAIVWWLWCWLSLKYQSVPAALHHDKNDAEFWFYLFLS